MDCVFHIALGHWCVFGVIQVGYSEVRQDVERRGFCKDSGTDIEGFLGGYHAAELLFGWIKLGKGQS